MKIINLGTETAPKWFAVATVSINGEEQDIIPAFTGYSIKQKDFSKDKVYTAMDKSKILPTMVERLMNSPKEHHEYLSILTSWIISIYGI